MATHVQIWLLHPGGEAGAAALARRLRDPAWTPGVSGWWRSVWAWWLGRSAKAEALPQLTGPDDELSAPGERLAGELRRVMGPRYSVLSVAAFGPHDPAWAARKVSMGDRVVLVPMTHCADAAVTAALVYKAEQALGRRTPTARVRLEPESEVEPQAQAIRHALLSGGKRAQGHGPRPVIFVAPAAPVPGYEAAWRLQLDKRRAALVAAARLSGPTPLAFAHHPAPWGGPAPRLSKVLGELAGTPPGVLVPLIHELVDPAFQATLEAAARESQPEDPFVVVHAPEDRPTLVRSIARRAQRAEVEAGWLEAREALWLR